MRVRRKRKKALKWKKAQYLVWTMHSTCSGYRLMPLLIEIKMNKSLAATNTGTTTKQVTWTPQFIFVW